MTKGKSCQEEVFSVTKGFSCRGFFNMSWGSFKLQVNLLNVILNVGRFKIFIFFFNSVLKSIFFWDSL